jgi:hypothetical protein
VVLVKYLPFGRMDVKATILLLSTLLIAHLGCTRRATGPWYTDGGPFMPETIGALSLAEPEAFPPQFQEAAKAASSYFVKRGLRPDLHFAQVFVRAADDIELAVWPASAFSPKGRRHGSGGGVSLHFNPRTHQIDKALLWQ